jgi:hypothetical protein
LNFRQETLDTGAIVAVLSPPDTIVFRKLLESFLANAPITPGRRAFDDFAGRCRYRVTTLSIKIPRGKIA